MWKISVAIFFCATLRDFHTQLRTLTDIKSFEWVRKVCVYIKFVCATFNPYTRNRRDCDFHNDMFMPQIVTTINVVRFYFKINTLAYPKLKTQF